jgi:histidyl-tRNA synthetase
MLCSRLNDMMPKTHKLKAQLPRGFADQDGADLSLLSSMATKIEAVCQIYGFARIETPCIEYAEALGKFMPDDDRPNEGVFSFQDDDEKWLSLRYDLTAPLARHVAEHFDALPKPYRTYRYGPVFRNEKPGPGRFRQFLQFDADTVGSSSPGADAEMCMMMADTLEVLGLKRGDYVVKASTRKIIDGVMEAIDVPAEKRGIVMRALDKRDRLGEQGVKDLLGKGRKDQSGDFTKGAELTKKQIDDMQRFLEFAGRCAVLYYPDAFRQREDPAATEACYQHIREGLQFLGTTPSLMEGLAEIEAMHRLFCAAGHGPDRIIIDPFIVRGLDYYTGAVFEAELTFPVTNDKGQQVVFGAVAGGGRYDGLVARFKGEQVPATGFSIGVSRLLTALKTRGLAGDQQNRGPVVVCTALGMSTEKALKFAQLLRKTGCAAEVYLGASNKLGTQLTYASKRHSPCAVIQGDDERAKGEVMVRDMASGTQTAVAEARLARAVQDICGHQGN